MAIAIQGQRHRLKPLEERTAKREENIWQKAQVVSLEPELVGVFEFGELRESVCLAAAGGKLAAN